MARSSKGGRQPTLLMSSGPTVELTAAVCRTSEVHPGLEGVLGQSTTTAARRASPPASRGLSTYFENIFKKLMLGDVGVHTCCSSVRPPDLQLTTRHLNLPATTQAAFSPISPMWFLGERIAGCPRMPHALQFPLEPFPPVGAYSLNTPVAALVAHAKK